MNTTKSRPDITATVSALSDRELLAQTRDLARVERHLQGAIIDHLAEIDARSLFLRRGYSSLFDYAVRELGYSDAAAARRIGAMRLCAEQPQARERLRDGSLSLSAAADLQWAFNRQRRRVPAIAPARPTAGAAPSGASAPVEPQPPLVLDEVGRQQLVDDAAGKSTRQVRQMLADLDPELAPPADRVRPLGNGRYELKAVIDADTQQGLEQLRGLLSHVDPRMSVGQLVGRLVREALDRHDPSRPPRHARTGRRPAGADAGAERTAPANEQAAARPKTERPAACGAIQPKQAVQSAQTAPAAPAAEPASDRRAAPASEPTEGPATRPDEERRTTPAAKSSTSRPAIPAATKRQVWQRDGGRCRYVDPQTGRRCASQHLLQIDHVHPHALGGSADPGNLRLLCGAHHRQRHAPRSLRGERGEGRNHPKSGRPSSLINSSPRQSACRLE